MALTACLRWLMCLNPPVCLSLWCDQVSVHFNRVVLPLLFICEGCLHVVRSLSNVRFPNIFSQSVRPWFIYLCIHSFIHTILSLSLSLILVLYHWVRSPALSFSQWHRLLSWKFHLSDVQSIDLFSLLCSAFLCGEYKRYPVLRTETFLCFLPETW
jgi:hypothetical protein